MVEFRWIRRSLFLTLLLQTTVTGQSQRVVIRDGDDVTLLCEDLRNDQSRCGNVDWLFAAGSAAAAVELVKNGQIGKQARDKSDRLSVTENCSLVIKKVTAKDAGQYTCRAPGSRDSNIFLFIISMTEDDDRVTLRCSVSEHRSCQHTVKWLYEGMDDKNNNVLTSQPVCSVSMRFPDPKLKLFVCKVTDHNTRRVQQFNFSRLSPVTEDEDDDATFTKSTIESRKKTESDSEEPPIDFTPANNKPDKWWLYILVAVGSVALILIIVAVIRWKRTKGNKTQMDANTVCLQRQNVIPAVTYAQETSEDMADPEDGICYASIDHAKKTCKARVQVEHGGDEGDSVTYSTLKASSSLTGASDNPGTLCAAVNKAKKRPQ